MHTICTGYEICHTHLTKTNCLIDFFCFRLMVSIVNVTFVMTEWQTRDTQLNSSPTFTQKSIRHGIMLCCFPDLVHSKNLKCVLFLNRAEICFFNRKLTRFWSKQSPNPKIRLTSNASHCIESESMV